MMETKDGALVSARGIGKSFGDRRVLDGLDLDVARGEVVAITGRSGSGKSTLLNIVGLLDPDGFEGELRLLGEPAPRPGSKGARMLLRSKIAYLFQDPALVEEATVEANLKIAQRYSNVSRDKRPEARSRALAEVGLAGAEKQKVYRLSGGERQRLALACLRVRPCELVLADEPTGSLDAGNRDEVLDFFEKLAGEGKGFLVVTHDPAVAARATKVVELK